MTKKKYSQIAYCTVSHLIETGHIVEYFKDNTDDFFLYIYPPSFNNGETIFRHYKNGLVYLERKKFWYRGNNKKIIYLFIFLSYWYFIYSFKIKNTKIIVNHPIFLFFLFFQKIFFRNTLILWIWDYFPSDGIAIKIYNVVMNFYVKRLNNVVFLTEAIKNEYTNLADNIDKKVITFGLSQMFINRSPVLNNLGFIGNLKNGQGFDIMFKLIQLNPTLKLEIVGDGAIKNNLIETSRKMNISDRIIFYGYQDEKKLKKISSKWAVGLALYENIFKNCTNFADPSKVKLYLELEIPVIMTNLTYFANVLENEKAGVCVNPDLDEIQKEISKINENYSLYQDGITKIKKKLEYNNKYDHDFVFLQKN